MPCSQEIRGIGENQCSFLRDELCKATRAACDMRTILRRFNLEYHLTGATLDWIEAHDEIDRKRIEKEKERGERKRMRQAALSKLNMDERRVLGL